MRGRKLVVLAVAGLMVGCGRNPQNPPTGNSGGSPTMSIPGPDVAEKPQPPNLDQPFAEAVSTESTGELLQPPDRTMAGLSTGKLRLDVEKLWDTIKFTTADGKAISYKAVFDTEQGKFTVQLRPEVAPNHVRNFICLAKAGYYNGLVFEHLIQEDSDDSGETKVEIVEGGCPLGTGEPGIAHLGYWLKPEFSDTAHEPGTFGAFHDESPDTAACRFYITVTKAPAMDGNFTAYGQVVAGLDVIRTISKQPKIEKTVQAAKPVVIRTVTIETAGQ